MVRLVGPGETAATGLSRSPERESEQARRAKKLRAAREGVIAAPSKRGTPQQRFTRAADTLNKNQLNRLADAVDREILVREQLGEAVNPGVVRGLENKILKNIVGGQGIQSPAERRKISQSELDRRVGVSGFEQRVSKLDIGAARESSFIPQTAALVVKETVSRGGITQRTTKQVRDPLSFTGEAARAGEIGAGVGLSPTFEEVVRLTPKIEKLAPGKAKGIKRQVLKRDIAAQFPLGTPSVSEIGVQQGTDRVISTQEFLGGLAFEFGGKKFKGEAAAEKILQLQEQGKVKVRRFTDGIEIDTTPGKGDIPEFIFGESSKQTKAAIKKQQREEFKRGAVSGLPVFLGGGLPVSVKPSDRVVKKGVPTPFDIKTTADRLAAQDARLAAQEIPTSFKGESIPFFSDFVKGQIADVQNIQRQFRSDIAAAKNPSQRKAARTKRDKALRVATQQETVKQIKRLDVGGFLSGLGSITRETDQRFPLVSRDPLRQFLSELRPRFDTGDFLPGIDVDITSKGAVALGGGVLGLAAVAGVGAVTIPAAAAATGLFLAGTAAASFVNPIITKATGSKGLGLLGAVGVGLVVANPAAALRQSQKVFAVTKIQPVPGQQAIVAGAFGRPGLVLTQTTSPAGQVLSRSVLVPKGVANFLRNLKTTKVGLGTSSIRPLDLKSLPFTAIKKTPSGQLAATGGFIPGGKLVPFPATDVAALGAVQSAFATRLAVAAVEKTPDFLPSEVTRLKTGVDITRLLGRDPSAFRGQLELAAVQKVQPQFRSGIQKVFEKQKKTILFAGSFAAAPQLAPSVKSAFTIGDIDLFVESRELFAKDIAATGIPAKLKGKTLQIGGEKVFDVKEFEELIGDKGSEVQTKPRETSILGQPLKQKPVKIRGFQAMPLSELFVRAASTTLTVQGGFLNPSRVGRVKKDTERFQDFFAPTLIESGKRSLNPLRQLRARRAETLLETFKATRDSPLIPGASKTPVFPKDTTTPKVVAGLAALAIPALFPAVTLPVMAAFTFPISMKTPVPVKRTGQPLTKSIFKEEKFITGTPEALESVFGSRFAQPKKRLKPVSPVSRAARGKASPIASPLTSALSSSVSVFQSAITKPKPSRVVRPSKIKTSRITTPLNFKSIFSSIVAAPSKRGVSSLVGRPSPLSKPTAPPSQLSSIFAPPTTPSPIASSITSSAASIFSIGKPTRTRPTPVIGVPARLKNDTRVRAYDAIVKRKQKKLGKGKFKSRGGKRVNTRPLSRAAAFDVGARTVDKYTNRSFTLRKRAGTVRNRAQPFDFLSLKRKFRKKKGDPKTYVEKTRYAIDSPQEKDGIPFEAARQRRAGLIKPKRKRKPQRKKNIFTSF